MHLDSRVISARSPLVQMGKPLPSTPTSSRASRRGSPWRSHRSSCRLWAGKRAPLVRRLPSFALRRASVSSPAESAPPWTGSTPAARVVTSARGCPAGMSSSVCNEPPPREREALRSSSASEHSHKSIGVAEVGRRWACAHRFAVQVRGHCAAEGQIQVACEPSFCLGCPWWNLLDFVIEACMRDFYGQWQS